MGWSRGARWGPSLGFSERPRDAEVDRFFQRFLDRRVRRQRQSVLGDRAVVPRTADGVFYRVMFGHHRHCGLEIAVAHFALAERAIPEGALGLRAAPE